MGFLFVWFNIIIIHSEMIKANSLLQTVGPSQNKSISARVAANVRAHGYRLLGFYQLRLHPPLTVKPPKT